MRFDIITLFLDMFTGPLSESIIKRAKEKGIIDINFHQLRDFGQGKHQNVDDTPCGGGKGMVLRVDVLDAAIKSVILNEVKNPDPSAQPRMTKSAQDDKQRRIILLSPNGRTYNQDVAKELSSYENIILVCGHYEGFDARIYDLVDETISIGDYVLTGGEIPAMAIVDSVSRLIPGVLSEDSPDDESFMQKDESGNYLLEYPQYTRPIEYKGKKVPSVLMSGNHLEISKWRNENKKIK